MEPIDKNVINAIVEKRIVTTFIFCLAALENKFGHLWGQNKSENEPLTESEEKYDELFEEWRKMILDFGNEQKRKAVKEIGKHL